jgi:hypothetical protein
MDSDAHKFHQEVIPGMLWASVTTVDGTVHIIGLVRLLDDDEGSAILESSDGLVANGEWSISRSRDEEDGAAPTAVSVTFPDTCDIEPSVLDELQAELVRCGGSWGLDGYQPAVT